MIYKLTISTIWSCLPWQKIYSKIFLLQREIYKSSQYCNLTRMHKYQRYLYNCNEVKIISIEIIIKYIRKYYKYINTERYNFNDQYKFKIFQYLFTKYLINDTMTLILELVKQHIMYLCIKPEWQSKNNRYRLLNYNFNMLYILQHDKYQILKKTYPDKNPYDYIQFDSWHKHEDINNYMKYIMRFLDYRKSINYWFHCKLWQKDIFNYTVFARDNLLDHLILQVYYNIISWHQITLHQINIYRYELFEDILIKFKRIICIDLIYQIKLLISFKFNFNQLRKNIIFNLSSLIYKISKYFINIYDIVYFLSNKIVKKVYLIMNNIIYYWCKKKYKFSIFRKYNYAHNKLLNQLLYQKQYILRYNIYTQFL